MAKLSAKPEARAQLEALKRDSAREQLMERVVRLLNVLRHSPGDRRVRQRRYHRQDCWGIPVHGSDEDWLIIWRRDGDIIDVLYIGPDQTR